MSFSSSHYRFSPICTLFYIHRGIINSVVGVIAQYCTTVFKVEVIVQNYDIIPKLIHTFKLVTNSYSLYFSAIQWIENLRNYAQFLMIYFVIKTIITVCSGLVEGLFNGILQPKIHRSCYNIYSGKGLNNHLNLIYENFKICKCPAFGTKLYNLYF